MRKAGAILLLFLLVLTSGPAIAAVRFGATTDLHYSDRPDWESDPFGEHRNYSKAPDRFRRFVAQANASDVEFCIQLGDALDGGTTSKLSWLNAFINDSKQLQMDFYNCLGNHEVYAFDGLDGRPAMADYFTIISADQAPQNNWWHPPDEANNPWAYTFDRDGFRFVVLWHVGNDGTRTYLDGLLEWLQNVALAAELPTVVFTHAHLHPFDKAYLAGDESLMAPIRAVLEASGKVVAVIQGHYHPGGSVVVINDIPYFALYGGVLAKDTNDYNSNAYYLFEVDPGDAQGLVQRTALITVEGYVYGSSTRGYARGNEWIPVDLRGDIDGDRDVDESDFVLFASRWRNGGCSAANGFCEGTDINQDGSVGPADLLRLSENWLEISADIGGGPGVNLVDFAVLAGDWLQNQPAVDMHFLPDGIIDLGDMALFTRSWLKASDR